MHRTPSHRLAHLRVLASSVVLSLVLAAITAAGVLADGGGFPLPH